MTTNRPVHYLPGSDLDDLNDRSACGIRRGDMVGLDAYTTDVVSVTCRSCRKIIAD